MTADQRKDFLWTFIVSVIILVLGSIPTWVGYQIETQELHFRGIYYDTQDYAAHIAMMEAGAHGEWAYQFRFTAESFSPAYVRIFYIVLGHLNKWLGLTSEVTYHLARWILGFVALFVLYRLMKQIFPHLFWARVAFLLAVLGSGLGWLQLIFNLTSSKITPIDFWFIDSHVFFSLSVFPHFAFVTIAMCVSLSLWLSYLDHLNKRNIVWIALIAIVVQFINPIAFATIDASFLGSALFAWWRTRRNFWAYFVALSILAIAQLPVFLYNVIVLSYDPLWSQYTSQHQTLSPPGDYYLWGFALFWPPAICGALSALRKKSSYLGAAVFWILTGFLLAYAPLYTQRRFLQNITIPLAILATQGLIELFEHRTTQSLSLKRWKKSFVLLFVFLASLSSIQLSLGRSLYLQTYPDNFFYSSRLNQAAAWLRENAHYNDVVLASEQTSQVLAQKAGVRAYFGHEMETLDYERKKEEVQSFFQGAAHELASEPIKWVIYGPAERILGPNFQTSDNLELVYDIPELQIYRVK